ncbi:Asp-tRNA(Asn)/Glu-tRNA(Gln) amidotransferase subunit GatB [Actinobaculum suis]|uniref:Asp-tRNA(Asn)/Glu-tRNA(Gln) amidotransferase subunit GatB n=1 Tax=Actinobaculum suis TaxID=1657 RepID=UPI0008086CEE|nr:Asp-tRNA(Asn)/Glu-tRNA(Gln) amidotransferase subunit GatB [Actinobaculum suis]OCA93866.1 aspartyl/glutamyl-tRNA amidotransferase subunit B [Actinobaculum suis]OCA95913.1 aspartyl/glutamyl-tRNA amidotransferase subunit B [Actinobaculum suis]
MDELMDFDEAIARFDPVIGLEVHVELSTETKIFDAAPVAFGHEPNTDIQPVSVGLPGSLPVLNKAAVEYAVRLGLALNSKINPCSRFDRKNYFYPDLPKAYQITQNFSPIILGGYLDVELADGTPYRFPIEHAHLEEDAGKNTHVGAADGRLAGAKYSLVDYNRAGVPLIEIVSEPATGVGKNAPEIAGAYVRGIREIVRALGISEGRMERGNIRADVNVSLRESPDAPFGTRTETKNVNSFRGIENTIRYEIQRQAAILAAGGEIQQETRNYSDAISGTLPGRVKSDADDYRYFPDPDLVPVICTEEMVAEIRESMPELPAAKKARVQKEWELSDEELRDVVSAGALEPIEASVQAGASPAGARKWWMGQIAVYAKDHAIELEDAPITPQAVAELDELVTSGKLTDKLARQALDGVLAGEGSPQEVVKARGLEVVSDAGEIERIVDEALAAQPDVLEKIKDGKVKAAGAIVGAVMKATRGKADAAQVNKIILQKAGIES